MSVQNNPNAISIANHPILFEENQPITFEVNHSITSEEYDRIRTVFKERINKITSYINSCKFSGVPHNTGTYIGDIENGLPHGAGRFDYKDYAFIGFWENGKINGYGRIYAKDKNCDGFWISSRSYGVSQIIFAGNLQYVGEISNYQPHGIGKFYYPNGSSYIGEVSRGLLHGKGTLHYMNGEKERKGLWENGEPVALEFHPKNTYVLAWKPKKVDNSSNF